MIFTPEERKALLALLALLLAGQGVSLWEQSQKARPDRALSLWLTRLSEAKGESLQTAGTNDSAIAAGRPLRGAPPVAISTAPGKPILEDQPGDRDSSEVDSSSAGAAIVQPSSGIPPGVLETGRIRINIASAADLEALPGIGPALAGRIVAERRAHGPFRGPSDLLRVRGIGPKKLARLADKVAWDRVEGGPLADSTGRSGSATSRPPPALPRPSP